jgi:hypothetical protein
VNHVPWSILFDNSNGGPTIMPDFNREILAAKPVNKRINELIEATAPPTPNERQYLGASSIGSECLRRIQFDWFVDPELPVRTQDIFARGHFFEELTRKHMKEAGFVFAPAETLRFETADGLFRGHGDGVLIGGPEIPELIYPALWEHKALKAKSWRAIERDGLKDLHRVYACQIAVYQAYLNLTNPVLFCVLNADDCTRLWFLVPFDPVLAQETSDRAVMVIEASKAGELLPRVTNDPEHWMCKACSHRAHCWSLS